MSRILNNRRKHASVLPLQKSGRDIFSFKLPRGQAYHGCLLTLYESDRHSSARVIAQPPRGARGSQELCVEWWHGSGDKVSYQLEAFTQPADSLNAHSPIRQLTGFVPEEHGFYFSNSFPSVPDITISIPFGRVEFGDASNGLCGGMVFTALDYFLAKRPIPVITKPPTTGELFNSFVRRLLNSFNLPLGVLKYIILMNPEYPDSDEKRSSSGNIFTPHGRAWQTIRVEWPIIKAMLDKGTPCPLGLVRVKSTDLSKLGRNHQVLATGYEVTDDLLTLFIYDPNYPRRNDLKLSVSLAAPERETPISYSIPQEPPVLAFFPVNYKFRSPPADS
ncbi:MAG: hypothetical protein HYZ21_06495 [Chloroflexi bacterium]|nr:hypothetical protein [Chloroflexota bacterium]